uniref:WAP four-disulfide core domain 1 n=1 Tax=Equus caballus TaxID=9796 RepID=F6SC02_HORSE
RDPPARAPSSRSLWARKRHLQPRDGQEEGHEEGHVGSVPPAAAPPSRFRQEHLETGVARAAGREVPRRGGGWLPAAPRRPLPAAPALAAPRRVPGGALPGRLGVPAPPALLLQRLRLRLPGGRAAPAREPPRQEVWSVSFMAVSPPPKTVSGRLKDTPVNLLDWLVQPKPRWLGGNGWLLDGPEETLQAEACSTTEDGAEPLLCPSGYECHILSPGDMAEGIPNRGQCVKQRRQADGRFLRHKFHREYPEGDSKNVAEHGKGQQRHFQ